MSDWNCKICSWEGSEAEVVFTDHYSCPECQSHIPYTEDDMMQDFLIIEAEKILNQNIE